MVLSRVDPNRSLTGPKIPQRKKAVAAHDSPGYQTALKVLGNAAERGLRIVEAVA